jgi:hypothetical protein
MAFVNEIPSAEDIEKYDLPYRLDLQRPIEQRRMWTADRERGVFLPGGGMTGNQAFDDDVKAIFDFYIAHSKFQVILEPRLSPNGYTGNPYHIHWPALLEIWAVLPKDNQMAKVPKTAWEQPENPLPILNGYSLNQFIEVFKEALSTHKAGDYNKRIHVPITVTFGF